MADSLERRHLFWPVGKAVAIGVVLGIVAWFLQLQLEFGLLPVAVITIAAMLIVWRWSYGEFANRRWLTGLASTVAFFAVQVLIAMLLVGHVVRQTVQMTWREEAADARTGEAAIALDFTNSPGSSLTVYSTRLLEDLRRQRSKEVQVEFEGYRDVGCPRMFRPVRINNAEFTPAGPGFGPLTVGKDPPFPSPWWCP
jgi:hypothetical protein